MGHIPSAEQLFHQSVEYLRLTGESFLSACVWLELKLVATGFDPILVIPLAVLVFFFLHRPKWFRIHNRRRFRGLWKWVVASPVFLFAGYALADEILY